MNRSDETENVRCGDTIINYHIRRSARHTKTILISVDRDGVRLAAPLDAEDNELRDVVVRRAVDPQEAPLARRRTASAPVRQR